MNIRPQCLPGGHNHAGHTPIHPWPEDCMVQWGGRGLVLGSKPYHTAFFEAFPAGTFIRGEGATVAEAEDRAWAQHQREVACGEHAWSPMQPGGRERLDGCGWCTRCGRFESKALPIRTVCGTCGKAGPLYTHEDCRACYDKTPDEDLDPLSLELRRFERDQGRS